MNFNRHLHPEIVCDLRGKTEQRDYYKNILNMVNPKGEGPGSYAVYSGGKVVAANQFDSKPAYTFSKTLIEAVNADVNMLDHWAMCRKFKDERPPVFHLSKDFIQALASIDKEIPIDILPEQYFCYLSFPELAIFDDTSWVQGAYVYVGKGRDCNMANGLEDEKIIWISYMGYPKPGQFDFDVTRVAVDLKPETITKLLSTLESVDVPELIPNREFLDPSKRDHVVRAIINALVYIHSQDPAIDMLRPTRNLSKSSKKALQASGGHMNDCMLPVRLLNWSYLKPRERHVGETVVKAHPRWQRCGPGNSQVKWILIDSFVRRYKDAETRPQE